MVDVIIIGKLFLSLSNWKSPSKRTEEDNMLLSYWKHVGGIIFTEVFVGKGGIQKWTGSAKPRRIDGVRVVLPLKTNGLSDDIITYNKKTNSQEFQQILSSGQVSVIEVKRSLNRVVLGQVIIGADLLEMEYNLTSVGQVVICGVGDPVLEAVCKRRNIEVWIPSKN